MSFKQIVLRALSTFGWSTLGYLIIAIPLWILAFIVIAMAASNSAYAATDHCPDHTTYPKVEAASDGELDSIVLEDGTLFCVKGGTSTSGNILTANGETTLRSYLGTGQNVSYYVVYGFDDTPTATTTTEPPATTTTTTTPAVVDPPATDTPLTEWPDETITGTPCVTPDGYPYTTSYATCPPAASEPAPVTELPRTGIGPLDGLLAGSGAILAGFGLRRLGRAA